MIYSNIMDDTYLSYDDQVKYITNNIISISNKYFDSKYFPKIILLAYYVNLSLNKVKFIDDDIVFCLDYEHSHLNYLSINGMIFHSTEHIITLVNTYVLLPNTDIFDDVFIQNIKVYNYEKHTLIIYKSHTVSECKTVYYKIKDYAQQKQLNFIIESFEIYIDSYSKKIDL